MPRRLVGTFLILLGSPGILFSALGVIGVWRAREDVAVAADDSLTLLSSTLQDIDRSLDVASTTLDGPALAMDSSSCRLGNHLASDLDRPLSAGDRALGRPPLAAAVALGGVSRHPRVAHMTWDDVWPPPLPSRLPSDLLATIGFTLVNVPQPRVACLLEAIQKLPKRRRSGSSERE